VNKKTIDVTEIRGLIKEFCLNKEGSRLLQEAIGSGAKQQLDLIF